MEEIKVGDRVKYVGTIFGELGEGEVVGEGGLFWGGSEPTFRVRFKESQTPYNCYRSSLELIKRKEETMEEVKKVYKPLVETSDGRLVSIWAGRRRGISLEYRVGEITYTPEGGAGIWVCETLEVAQGQGKSNSRTTIKDTSGALVVHEATILGEKCGAIMDTTGLPDTFSDDIRYPAILLGKEVWREVPKEEWKDVTRECSCKILSNVLDNYHILVSILHEDKQVGALGLNQIELSLSEDYRVEPDTKTGAGTQWFRVFKRNS